MNTPAPVPALPPRVAKTRVLCIDDEAQILEGLALTLGRRYEILTASSGAAGLEILKREANIAVIVSDMRMPEMDGAKFLAQAHLLLPDTVRILLTGYAEVSAAIAAVNEGQIFRFLTKPCAPPELLATLEAAVKQHRLVTAERVLLEQTLQGSIRTLTEVLALANPLLFGRATRIKQLAGDLATAVQLSERWQLEVAAMLAQLALITLPPEVAEKVCYGRELSAAEQAMFEKLPQVTDHLLGHIPRLEVVRQMIAWQTRPFKRSEYLQPNRDEALAAQGAQILKVALDFNAQIAGGASIGVALGTMRLREDYYDPQILQALSKSHEGQSEAVEIRNVSLAGLLPGMTFAEDVRTSGGTLLVTCGTEVTQAFLERIGNYRPGTLKTPLRVIMPTVSREAAYEKENYIK